MALVVQDNAQAKATQASGNMRKTKYKLKGFLMAFLDVTTGIKTAVVIIPVKKVRAAHEDHILNKSESEGAATN